MLYVNNDTSVIEAFQYDGDLKGSDGKYYVPDWAVEAYEKGELLYIGDSDFPPELFIKQDERLAHVPVGYYVVFKKGELLSYPPYAFECLYIAVDDLAKNNAARLLLESSKNWEFD